MARAKITVTRAAIESVSGFVKIDFKVSLSFHVKKPVVAACRVKLACEVGEEIFSCLFRCKGA